MNVTLTSMRMGDSPKRVHVKVYAADQAHNPSQIVDTASPLVFSVLQGAGVASTQVDPNDNRAVLFTPTAVGTTTINVNKSTTSPGGTINYTLTVNPAFVDNSRVDHLSEDP